MKTREMNVDGTLERLSIMGLINQNCGKVKKKSGFV